MFFAKKLVKFFSAALAASMFSFGAAFAAGGKIDILGKDDIIGASIVPREREQRWDFKFKCKKAISNWQISNADEFYITKNALTGDLEVHHPDQSFPLYKLKTFSDHWSVYDWEEFKDCDITLCGTVYKLVTNYGTPTTYGLLPVDDNPHMYSLYRKKGKKYLGCELLFSDPTSTAPSGLLPLAMFFVLHYGLKAL